MKILQVVHGIPPYKIGGTEIYTYQLSRELSKKHEVHIVYPSFTRLRKRKIEVASYRREGIFLHEIVQSSNFLNRMINSLFFRSSYINQNVENAFIKIIDKVKPDIIHFEHLVNLSATLVEIAKEREIPAVLTLHDYWFLCPNIRLLTYNYEICMGPRPEKCYKCWKKVSAKLSESIRLSFLSKDLTRDLTEIVLRALNSIKEFERRNRYLLGILSNKIDRVIAPSNFLREMFIKYGVPSHKIVKSENGYPVRIFKHF